MACHPFHWEPFNTSWNIAQRGEEEGGGWLRNRIRGGSGGDYEDDQGIMIMVTMIYADHDNHDAKHEAGCEMEAVHIFRPGRQMGSLDQAERRIDDQSNQFAKSI